MLSVAYPKKETAPFFECTNICFNSSTGNVPVSFSNWTTERLLMVYYGHILKETCGRNSKNCLKHTVKSTILRGRYFHCLRWSSVSAHISAVNVFCFAEGNSIQAYDLSLQKSLSDIVLKARMIIWLFQWSYKALLEASCFWKLHQTPADGHKSNSLDKFKSSWRAVIALESTNFIYILCRQLSALLSVAGVCLGWRSWGTGRFWMPPGIASGTWKTKDPEIRSRRLTYNKINLLKLEQTDYEYCVLCMRKIP